MSSQPRALVLAGGVGTRFHPYTEIIPKSMIPIGKKEKPVLELIVRWLKKHDIRDFVFLVNYKWRYIYNYFGRGKRFGVRIDYSLDGNGYGGTGGAILKAYREKRASGRSIVWYGDILATLDVKDLLRFHEEKGADISLVVATSYQVPVGVVELSKDGRVVSIAEKPFLKMNVTIGVAVVEESVFSDKVEETLGKVFDFMGDFIPWLMRKGYKVYGYAYNGWWVDVGSLERYKKVDTEKLWVLEST